MSFVSLCASLYHLVPRLGKASPRLLLASHSINLVGLRPGAALSFAVSPVSACPHLNVSRLVSGLGRASPRLRLVERKLKCVGTTFCSRKSSPELRRHDFSYPEALISSPEGLPGPPRRLIFEAGERPRVSPGGTQIPAWEGGGPQRARHKEKWILAESSS